MSTLTSVARFSLGGAVAILPSIALGVAAAALAKATGGTVNGGGDAPVTALAALTLGAFWTGAVGGLVGLKFGGEDLALIGAYSGFLAGVGAVAYGMGIGDGNISPTTLASSFSAYSALLTVPVYNAPGTAISASHPFATLGTCIV